MSANDIFGKTAKYDQKSFLHIFVFYGKWEHKCVFDIFDISHFMKFSVLCLFEEFL